jgi:hypothetical protein
MIKNGEKMNIEKINPWQEVFQFVLHPRRTMTSILQNQSYGWFIPLILTTGLLLVFSIVQHNMVNKQSQLSPELYMDPMMGSSDVISAPMGKGGGGAVYMDESTPMEGLPVQTGESTLEFVLKTLARLGGLWLVWLLFATMLHLGLMIAGGNLEQRAIFRLVAWTTLIFAVRTLIQILFMLISGQPILGDGLSGMLPEVNGQLPFLAYILSGVDIYFILQLILLFMGFHQSTNLAARKIASALLVSALILLGLSAIPAFIMEKAFAALSSSAGLF